MKPNIYGFLCFLFSLFLIGACLSTQAQNQNDAFTMNKNQICLGGMYSQAQFDHYWEGTKYRGNLNFGTITDHNYGFMGIYGITNTLSVLASLSYVQTHASAGTLHGLSGLQDLGIDLKYKALYLKGNNTQFTLYGLGGITVPASNYLADYLPLSIGLKSRTLTGRILGDFQFHHYFITASYYFTFRSNIAIDRNAYYTTQLILSDQVQMPNLDGCFIRTGYRSVHFIAEATFQNYTTLGGFDITTNNMPFPSNRMNWDAVGVNLKYEFKKPLNGFTLYAGGQYVFQGRNIGQMKTFDAGLFYAFYLSKHSHSSKSNTSIQ
jgi:hypothetical protein